MGGGQPFHCCFCYCLVLPASVLLELHRQPRGDLGTLFALEFDEMHDSATEKIQRTPHDGIASSDYALVRRTQDGGGGGIGRAVAVVVAVAAGSAARASEAGLVRNHGGVHSLLESGESAVALRT